MKVDDSDNNQTEGEMSLEIRWRVQYGNGSSVREAVSASVPSQLPRLCPQL